MDPNAEHLHRLYDEQQSSTLAVRERLTEGIAGALSCSRARSSSSSPILRSPTGDRGDVRRALRRLLAGDVQSRLRGHDARAAVVRPDVVRLRPALLPALAVASHLAGSVVATLRSHGRRHWGRIALAVPDAWYAVGPAIVLTALGTQGARLEDWWIYALALAAQFAVDGLTSFVRCYAAAGITPREQLPGMGWMWCVDAALTPIALVLALSLHHSPALVLAMLPLAGLLALFAKEREDRIQNALELSSAYRGTARLMGDVLEADDAYTGGEHTQGVVELSLAVGRAVGLSAQQLRTLEFGALLHDIGKLRVPNEIINKPGKLNDEEWAIIKRHPGYGQEMLDRVGGELSHAGRVVRAHHERWDGAGYPDGLAGDAIPIEARIITVCDSFSAMTTDRSYRKGMRVDDALAELRRCAGSQFEPRLVEVLEQIVTATRSGLASVDGDAPRPAPVDAGADVGDSQAA